MQFEVIAHVRTCYGEKFGVPRQPGLVAEAWGEVVFEPAFRKLDTLRGLEGFSHLWLVFVFHKAIRKEWKATVRPPRLGGNEKVGVFASRSPFRPNPIGLSCVQLDRIDQNHPEGPVLKLRGIDLVDGTPLLDIKPYIPYSDQPLEATGGFADGPPASLKVQWSSGLEAKVTPALAKLIEATLACDPRPAYQGDDNREYGCVIENLNVRWRVTDHVVIILSCDPV